MDATLLTAIDHPMWHRVCDLRVRLRGHVRVQRREARGEAWYLLIDPASGRFHRVNESAYRFVGCIDGRNTVGALWQHVYAQHGEQAPTQSDVMHLLSVLSDAELVSLDAMPDLQALLVNKRRRERGLHLAGVNPLAFKVPLFDPSRVLDSLLPLGRWVFNVWGALVWLAVMAAAGGLALVQASLLRHGVQQLAPTPTLLFTLWLAYPIVKLLHEFGHALALRTWGGEVHEMGVVLMALTPVPYVDASAATRLPQRHRRMIVSAAGMMVELSIAALALVVWSASADADVQSVALALVVMCSVSTLLFNGNPLLRFDGYHVLSDALDLPNLGRRADAVLLRGLQRLLRLPYDQARAERVSEAPGLALYGVLSAVYRWFIGLSIVVWLHETWPLLALAVATWLLWSQAARPLLRGIGYVLFDGQLNGQRSRALAGVAALTCVLGAALAVWPMPSASVQQGVVWLPDQAVLRAPVDGTLQEILVASGQNVAAGTPVAVLENLNLQSDLASARAKAVSLDVQHLQALFEDSAKASRLAEELSSQKARIDLLAQRLDTLALRTEVAGKLVLPRTDERLGHFFPQGRELGYVLPDGPPMVKVALTEAQAALLDDRRPGRVSVRLATEPLQAYAGFIERRTPQTTLNLPSAALGQGAGGPIATEPADAEGRKALVPVVLVDVRLKAEAGLGLPDARLTLLGQRAWVRFEYDSEPLLAQGWRSLRRLFLRSLGART